MSEYIQDQLDDMNSLVITNDSIRYQKTSGTHGGSTEMKMAGEGSIGVVQQSVSQLCIDDLLNAPQFNYTVGKYGLHDDFAPTGRKLRGKSHLVREDNGAPFGIVPNTYHPLQTIDALEKLRPLEEKGLAEVAKAGSLEGGKRIWALLKMKGREIQPIQGDSILAYWMLKFNHGESKEKIHITPVSIRLACENGMISFDDCDYALDFTRDATEGIEEVIDMIPELENEMSKAEKKLKILAETRVPESLLEEYFRRSSRLPWNDPAILRKLDAIEDLELRDQAYADFEKKLHRGKRQVTRLFACYQEEAETLPEAHQDSWYQAYNAVTRFTTHVSGSSSQHRFRSNWYGSGARTRKEALALAAEYAIA